MQTDIRTTDAKARLVLPKSFANSTVIVEQLSETEVRIRRAKVIAEDDLPFMEEASSSLSDRDRDKFLDLLSDPPAPNRALKKAAGRYKGAVVDWSIERLSKEHDWSAFTCGKPSAWSDHQSIGDVVEMLKALDPCTT